MEEGDKWYYRPKNVTYIKIVIIIAPMVFVALGFLLSQKFSDVQKNFFQSVGILLSFMGFILMLVPGTEWKPSPVKERTINFYVSIHQVNLYLIIGAICIFLGFGFQAMGIGKIPF